MPCVCLFPPWLPPQMPSRSFNFRPVTEELDYTFQTTHAQPDTHRNLPISTPRVFWSIPGTLTFAVLASLAPSWKEENAQVMEFLFSKNSLQFSPKPSSHRTRSLVKILRSPEGGRNGGEFPNPFHYFKDFGMHSGFGWMAAISLEASIAAGVEAKNHWGHCPRRLCFRNGL